MIEIVRVRVAKIAVDLFVDAAGRAQHHLDKAVGFRGLRLQRCIEEPDLFILLVEWRGWSDVESFRRSPAHEDFRALLDRHILGAEVHHFEEAE